MSQPIAPSELILNKDGSIYHLNLRPDDIADTIILVGDQARVPRISQHFDRIDVQKQHREFLTHTGWIGSKHLSVISTGIGTPNIDIVLNELDALATIDFETRQVKSTFNPLTFCRMGTCGGLSPELACGDFVFSSMAVSVDRLMTFYRQTLTKAEAALSVAVGDLLEIPADGLTVGSASVDWKLPDTFHAGYTFTGCGFYGPQGRRLRLPVQYPDLLERLRSLRCHDMGFLNLEMETAAILALARALGHHAASLSVVLADRVNQTFAQDVNKCVDHLIQVGLDQLVA